mgnify:CR=1 FL=1
MDKIIVSRLNGSEPPPGNLPPLVIHQSQDNEDLFYLLDAPGVLITLDEALKKAGDNCTPVYVVYVKDWRGY